MVNKIEADKIKRSRLPCQHQVILIWSPISYPFALKGELLLCSHSPNAVRGAMRPSNAEGGA